MDVCSCSVNINIGHLSVYDSRSFKLKWNSLLKFNSSWKLEPLSNTIRWIMCRYVSDQQTLSASEQDRNSVYRWMLSSADYYWALQYTTHYIQRLVWLTLRLDDLCDVMWCYMIWYDMMWYDVIWYDMIWYDVIWYDMIWYDVMWYDVIWYDVI